VSNTRAKLIEAAARLLDTGGPDTVTLRAVSLACGVSHNAPYKHFASKEDLLAAIASRELMRRAATQAGQRGQKDPRLKLRTRMHTYVQWARVHPERFKLVFRAWSKASDELIEAAAAARRALIVEVADAMQVGQIVKGDPERVAFLILALAHGAADLSLGGHLSAKGKGKADPEDLVDDLFSILRPSPSVKGNKHL